MTRSELIDDPSNRLILAADVLERTTATSFQHFFLYDLLTRHKPHIVIDSINTATGVAYQDVYSSALKVLEGVRKARSGNMPNDFLVEVEKLLNTLYLPQLVRHIQILYQGMKDAGTQSYIKVGTTGTGGMGLNIPYTHSEDKPSRVLLSKSCIGGAHSLLLMLMARTPDAPYTKEIKPAAAIAWKRIEYGEVLRHGNPIPLWDCAPDQAVYIEDEFDVKSHTKFTALNRNLEAVFIDTGENGTFSLGEYTAITTCEQMEYVTPEEISQAAIWEIEGGNSGHDIVGALDAAILSPSYRAGVMRHLAIDKMQKLISEHSSETVAFELLGPPRLSKLLYEAHILKLIASSIDNIRDLTPEELSSRASDLIFNNQDLRSRIISIGIPILLPDGKQLLRGPDIKVPQDPRRTRFTVSPDNIENWCSNGWVDLRVSNMEKWHQRLDLLRANTMSIKDNNSSSHNLRDVSFWHPDSPLDEGELVGWIFIHEDKGRRMK